MVSDESVEADKDIVVTINDWLTPRCKRDVQAFLGICRYYRRFISRYAKISRPLTLAAAWDLAFCWNEECQEAFRALKERLMNTPVLSYPDSGLPFILDTDASKVGDRGRIISSTGQERVIAYYSKLMSSE